MRQVQGSTGVATGAAGSMQHRGAHAGKGLHRGRACRRSRAGMHGRQQRQGADWQGGTGRRARWATAAWEDAHAGGKRERARAGGSLQVLSARNQGGSGVYIGRERGFLACVSRKTAGLGLRGSGCGEEKKRETGRTAGLGRKDFFLFSFFCKKIQQI